MAITWTLGSNHGTESTNLPGFTYIDICAGDGREHLGSLSGYVRAELAMTIQRLILDASDQAPARDDRQLNLLQAR